jgi:WD40 repeat protein
MQTVQTENEKSIHSIAILPNGNLISASLNLSLHLWDLNSFKCLGSIGYTTRGLILPLPNGYIITGSISKGYLNVLDSAEDFNLIKNIYCPIIPEKLFLLSNGNIICSGNNIDDKIDHYGYNTNVILDSKEYLFINKIDDYYFNSLVNVPNDKFVSGGIEIIIWDSIDYKVLKTLKGHRNITALIYNNIASVLISSAQDRTIRLWDANSEYHCIRILYYDAAILSLLSLPGGYFAVGCANQNIKIWDLCNCACINTIVQSCSVSTMMLLGRSRIISCCSSNNKIFIWDI